MQFMNIIFVCNEELKGGMQGFSLCLLGNQLKFKLQPFGCKRARATIKKDYSRSACHNKKDRIEKKEKRTSPL